MTHPSSFHPNVADAGGALREVHPGEVQDGRAQVTTLIVVGRLRCGPAPLPVLRPGACSSSAFYVPARSYLTRLLRVGLGASCAPCCRSPQCSCPCSQQHKGALEAGQGVPAREFISRLASHCVALFRLGSAWLPVYVSDRAVRRSVLSCLNWFCCLTSALESRQPCSSPCRLSQFPLMIADQAGAQRQHQSAVQRRVHYERESSF
jgi:hypothetical protein